MMNPEILGVFQLLLVVQDSGTLHMPPEAQLHSYDGELKIDIQILSLKA